MRTVTLQVDEPTLDSFDMICARRHIAGIEMIRTLVIQYVVDHMDLLEGHAGELGGEASAQGEPSREERPAKEIREMYERISRLKGRMPQRVWVLLSAVEMHLKEVMRSLGTAS